MPDPNHELPEPFASALARGRIGDVVDQEANTPAAHLARARARISAGRFDEARADLDAAQPRLGDAALIERAWLDLRQRGALREALRTARDVAARARRRHAAEGPRAPRPGPRAVATEPVAEGRRHPPRGAGGYDEAGDERAVSHVERLHRPGVRRARRPRAGPPHYSLSLVDKASLGDRLGLAVTIGNIGRLQLRAGRYEDAIACFERDLAISMELGDLRGRARMLEDLGRAYAGLEDDARAEPPFLGCLALAEEHGFTELVFYAHLDLAALRLRAGRLDEAARAHRRGVRHGPRPGDAVLRADPRGGARRAAARAGEARARWTCSNGR